MRPYCISFLKQIRYYYDIYVFTASHELYADAIVELLDPNYELIKGIFSRKMCLLTNRGYFVKDLSIIENIGLKDMVLIDDKVQSFALQLNNGIPIKRWENDPDDKELKYLLPLLIKFSADFDVREVIKNHFGLEKLALLNRKSLFSILQA